jgi:hypothetical protein
MNAITAIEPLDDIATFLPGIDPEEYERRSKLRSLRNVAGAMIARTESPTARQLAWICSEYTTELVYLPAGLALLDDVAKFCNRLMITALHAERLETVGAEQ